MNRYSKVILTVMMVVLGFGISQAEFRFGLKAGLNLNSLDFSKIENSLIDSENRCGFTVGPMVEFTVPIIGIGVDVSAMYTRMNSNGEVTVIGNSLTEERDATIGKDFIEIPVNLKYKLGLPVISRIVKPYVYTGPAFAFKLNKNTLKDIQTKTCQVAWNIGIGFEFIRHLQIQGSYGFGINNIASHIPGVGINTTDVKLKNNYWTITAGWLF